MKKLAVVVLLVALSVIKVSGQVGPVFQYTSPSIEALKSLAKQESVKGETYRNYLIKTINIGLRDTTLRVDARYVDYIFNHLFLEEVNLEDDMFKNSGYDPITNSMCPSLGHKIGWGFQWVFRIGTFTIVIIKRDCGNILEVPVIRRKVELPPEKPVEKVQQQQLIQLVVVIVQKSDSSTVNKSVTEIGHTPFLKTTAVKIGGTVIVLGGVGVLVKNLLIPALFPHKKTIVTVEPRTMPPGIPTVTPTPGPPTPPPVPPTSPGLPSDPRTMPGGIGKTF